MNILKKKWIDLDFNVVICGILIETFSMSIHIKPWIDIIFTNIIYFFTSELSSIYSNVVRMSTHHLNKKYNQKLLNFKMSDETSNFCVLKNE